MRIIAGKLRGKKIKAPKGLTTRPVLARVREALFNILGSVEGLRVLDLYAGTGAMGIEALSRGAASAVFVDNGFVQCRLIQENASSLGKEAVVIRADVKRVLGRLKREGQIFDLVFCDPPYESGLSEKTLMEVCKNGLMSESGMMVLPVRYTEKLPEHVGNCTKIFDRRYGDTRLMIYAKKDITS